METTHPVQVGEGAQNWGKRGNAQERRALTEVEVIANLKIQIANVTLINYTEIFLLSTAQIGNR